MNKEIKIGAWIVAAILTVALALNCYTIITTNHEGSVQSFGKVHEGKVLTGFNLVAPWWSIDEYSLQHDTMSYDDLGIASQDKFKTNMDVAFTGNFLTGYADKTRSSTGSADKFLSTHVYKRVLSCLTKAGMEVEDSQAFFQKDIQIRMAESTKSCVNDYLAGVGGQFELSTVQFSDIRLDPRVAAFMLETKKRQEAETIAQSNLAIAETDAQVVVKQAAARLQAAADDKASAILKAEGLSQSKILEATGNQELSKSINGELIRYIEAQRWDGKRSQVVAGAGTELLIDTRSK
jgi:regulator of protease activity HflC (stomatin/prohibitin superfamily)